jgi:hypothetical protein
MHKQQYKTFAIHCFLTEHGHGDQNTFTPPWFKPYRKNLGYPKTRVAAKIVTLKLWDVQQLAEQNFATVAMEEWAAVCRHVTAVEEEYRSRARDGQCHGDDYYQRWWW